MENVKLDEGNLGMNQAIEVLEKTDLVYCTKCGFKNEDDAEVCVKCGASLQMSRAGRRRRSDDECFGFRERDWEGECFGLRHSGSIVGLIFGIMIVLIGASIILGTPFWVSLGAFLIIAFGLLIILGVLFGKRRRY